MTKVFIITYSYFGDHEIHGVYSSLEKAQEYVIVQKLRKHYIWIEEWETDGKYIDSHRCR